MNKLRWEPQEGWIRCLARRVTWNVSKVDSALSWLSAAKLKGVSSQETEGDHSVRQIPHAPIKKNAFSSTSLQISLLPTFYFLPPANIFSPISPSSLLCTYPPQWGDLLIVFNRNNCSLSVNMFSSSLICESIAVHFVGAVSNLCSARRANSCGERFSFLEDNEKFVFQ